MTTRECAIVEAYTGYCMLQGVNRRYFYEYIEKLCGRPIYTHELAKQEVIDLIQAKAKPDFIELCMKTIYEEVTDGNGD